MRLSNSKKELARIISENGGWRDGSNWAFFGPLTGMGYFGILKPTHNKELRCMETYGVIGGDVHAFECSKIANWHQTILSREEYFHLYPAPDADRWIEWNGGECPVDRGVLVDVRYRCGKENIGVTALLPAKDSGFSSGLEYKGFLRSARDWSIDGHEMDIIAYRLHRSEQAKPEFCESVMRSIPEPTAKPSIEQLAADYRNRKDYSDRKQQEADAAKEDAEAKWVELVAAGKALGLVLIVADVDPEPELVITDWRDLQVGDIIQCVGEWQGAYTDGFEFEVTDVEAKQYGGELAVRVEVPDVGGTWGKDFKFIRRP